MRIMVTGANGFIGRNFINTVGQSRKDIEILPYDIDSPVGTLDEYAANCDFAVHLAGVNRPKEQGEFKKGNAGFTGELVNALEKAANPCPILMTSSIQAQLDNPYGTSKLEAENVLREHEKKTGAKVYIYRLPNVFGKFCRPNYNSAVATFCHNIAHDLPITVTDPKIELRLIYIDDVVRLILDAVSGVPADEPRPVYRATLGHITELIYSFKNSRSTLVVPDMADEFTRKLYATYLSYLDENDFSYDLTVHADHRGSFTEFIKTEGSGQFSVNVSRPGAVKGNHYHDTKNEKFLVVAGEAIIRFRKVGSDKVIEYRVKGCDMRVIDIPTGYTHNIENVGQDDLITIMWASERFDPDRPDTYYLEV
ncbi:MAG: NAD-dependent epimerase/dehydratase family protein [Clostridia bacterium]|nr:NAD-dependent epimerase/dehydratase family protein [Clostridia bacterium]